jgi:hypothetical protein
VQTLDHIHMSAADRVERAYLVLTVLERALLMR